MKTSGFWGEVRKSAQNFMRNLCRHNRISWYDLHTVAMLHCAGLRSKADVRRTTDKRDVAMPKNALTASQDPTKGHPG